jgi:hypothetical protein
MERVVVELSPFSRRSRSLAVSHVACGLRRGLEQGEYVVLHDPVDGTDFTASVADIGFELEDTVYRLELGTRITADEAAEWQAPATDEADAPMSTRRLMDLLGELRRRERALQEVLGEIARS